MSKKTSIIVPIYNESHMLSDILDTLVSLPIEKELILIDDGSTDNSPDIAVAYSARYAFISFFRFSHNCGKGAALKKGFSLAQGDFIIVHDADLEYQLNDLVRLTQLIEERALDVIFGSRYLSKENATGYLSHRLSNILFTTLSNVFTGLHLTDVTSCYKIFRRELLLHFELRENRFSTEVELVSHFGKLWRAGRLRYEEVAIGYTPRTFKEGKKISWRDGFNILYSIIKYR